MTAEVGFFLLVFAFITALYAAIVSVVGASKARGEKLIVSGRNAAYLTAILVTASLGTLLIALVRQDYQIAYVWSVTSPDMNTFYRLTALWGSQSGSLLFWSFLMSLFSAISISFAWKRYHSLVPYAIAVMMVTVAFFVGLSVFLENPFERWWLAGGSGDVMRSVLMPAGAFAPEQFNLQQSAQGLNPMLRHWAMAIHPPLLYLGFVGFVIPFAYAIGALASGNLSTDWIKASRRFTLVAWMFLSLGLLLGGRWAYDVLGWGGYWGWDPVENAAFLPWLVGTALLHSTIIQEKRGMLKTWNMALVVLTFSAVIFGTFATRSGLVESVHSFARSEIGFPMFAFWFGLSLVAVVLILWRRGRGDLRAEHKFQGLLSRESLFVLNNVVFVALFMAIFWGSFGAPIISELVMNTNITLGTDYFLRVTPPLFAALYILMGVAPLSGWGVTSMRRLGRAALIPIILSLVCLGLFALSGMSSAVSFVAYFVVLLAGWVAVVETIRGILARHRAHRENLFTSTWQLFNRNPRRYGGYMIHFGMTVIGIGVIGSTLFQVETQRTLQPGQTLDVAGYTMRYDGLLGNQVADDGRLMDIAQVTVMRDGQELAHIRPRRDYYPQSQGTNSMTIAGSYSTLENDFYVLLVNWEPINANQATFKVYINPLINWIWTGGLILIVGTFLAAYPKDTVSERARKSVAQPKAGQLARGGA
ncbi:MAG: cytochrome c-type biogenesis CcmF C-terminal domain-containing protein [Anaerolineae bacterium]